MVTRRLFMGRIFRLFSGLLAFIVVLPGCQTWTQKRTLPSPRYLEHPPQYIPPSPSNPLPKETPAQSTNPQPLQKPEPALPQVPPALQSPSPVTILPSPRPPAMDPYVVDLLDLISQTKSVDAFLVSVSLLAEAKTEARQVIPTVIRNAERLGIYGRYAMEEKAKGAQVAKDLTELIGKMIKGKGSNDKKN